MDRATDHAKLTLWGIPRQRCQALLGIRRQTSRKSRQRVASRLALRLLLAGAKMMTRCFAFASVLAFAAHAHADTRVAAMDPPGMTPPNDDAPGVTATAPAQPDPIELRAASDAASDRAYVLSTALVVPAGTVEVGARGLAPVGGFGEITAGLGSGLQISADVGGVVGFDDEDGGIATYSVGAKFAIAHGRTWQLAASGNHRWFQDGYDAGSDSVDTGELLLSNCLDDDCAALSTVGFGALHGGMDTTPFATASLIAGGRTAKIVVETMGNTDGGLGYLGLRLGGDHVAFDVGLLGGAARDGGGAVIPLPLLGISVRP